MQNNGYYNSQLLLALTLSHQLPLGILNLNYLPKLIFLEKPVCENLEQLNLLINLSNDKGVKIIANHSRRFDPKMIQLKKLILKI